VTTLLVMSVKLSADKIILCYIMMGVMVGLCDLARDANVENIAWVSGSSWSLIAGGKGVPSERCWAPTVSAL